MSNVDPLADLAIRRQQLETHLLLSHEYREKAARRLKLLAFIKLIALILILAEAVIYMHEPRLVSPVVILGLFIVTMSVLVTSGILIWHAWCCLHRLNERWLVPDARKALEALKLEQARARADRS